VPKDAPKVAWTVKEVDDKTIGISQVIAKDLIGHVDNSSYPLLDVNIHMTLITPAHAKGPVPVLIMFGGVKPSRRVWGEQVENLTGGYYSMAGSFMKYGAKESSFGQTTVGDLPVDSPELIALCAPRLVFVSYGGPEKGRCKMTRSPGQLHGRGRRAPSVFAARRARARSAGRLPHG
jgi:hypothetical protein